MDREETLKSRNDNALGNIKINKNNFMNEE